MLLSLYGNRIVHLNDYPDQLAIQIDVRKSHPETGIFLEHDGSSPHVCRSEPLTPILREDSGFGDQLCTYLIPIPKDYAGAKYRCTLCHHSVYMEYPESTELVVRAHESGWSATYDGFEFYFENQAKP